MHGAVGEDEHDVGAAGAALLPFDQLELAEIGDEIGLPHVAARFLRDEVPFAGEIVVVPLALGKSRVVGEDEVFVAEHVHHHRQVVGGRKARPGAAGAIEVLVLGVQRQGEQAFRPPFETVGLPVMGFHGRAAMALEDVEHLLIEMLLGVRRAAGLDVDDEHGEEISPPLEMDEGAIGAEARPRRGLDLGQIDAEILDRRDTFVLGPVEVGIEQEFRFFAVCRHWRCLRRLQAIILRIEDGKASLEIKPKP